MAVTYSGDAATTRTNLGLGSLATANSVNGSTIDDNSVSAAELNVSGNGTSGQLLSSDGDGSFSWVTVSGGGDYIMRTYNSPATWAKPANCKAIKVTVVGGGGGGCGVWGQNLSVCHGGGGGTAIEYLDAPAVSANVAVTVGAGGSGGPASTSYPNGGAYTGGNGGTSSFGGYLSATGGGRCTGAPSGTGNGGAGGVGSGGDLNLYGGSSSEGGRRATIFIGSSISPPSGGHVGYNSTGNGISGTYGGGGTGGRGSSNNGTATGGAGGTGVVIVEEFY